MKASHAADADETAFRAALALNHYSQARIAANAYRSTSEPDEVARTEQALLAFESAMNDIYAGTEDGTLTGGADRIIGDAIAYGDAFAALVRQSELRNRNVDMLVNEIGTGFDRDAAIIIAALERRARGTAAQAKLSFAVMLATVAALVAARRAHHDDDLGGKPGHDRRTDRALWRR